MNTVGWARQSWRGRQWWGRSGQPQEYYPPSVGPVA